MKKIIILFVLVFAQNLYAQNIERFEYFIDSDPGYGQGSAISITPVTDLDIYFTIDLSGVEDGFHVLVVRVKDENGVWSMAHSKPFYKESKSPESPDVNISRIEYYIDTDPGYGKGTDVPVSSDISIDENFVVDLSGVEDGFHVLVVRVKDENGVWSIAHSMPFYKEFPTTEESAPLITSIEYYFNNGSTSTTPVKFTDFTPSNDVDIIFKADLTGFSLDGTYIMVTTAVDDAGRRSLDYAHSFLLTEQSLFLTSPNGGEELITGTTHTITWGSTKTEIIKIEYSTDGGSNWNEIVLQVNASAGSYSWTVPDFESSECKIKITDVSDATFTDESDVVFTIEVSVELTTPMPETFTVGNPFPNPFNAGTTISYSLPHSGDVRIAVYNVLGQIVFDETFMNIAPGNKFFKWNGKDSVGNPVKSGVYFIKVAHKNSSVIRKTLHIK